MTKPCPICGSQADTGHSSNYGDRNQYACPRCGNYEISRTAQIIVRGRIADEPNLAALVSHRLRNLQNEGEWPLVSTYTLNELTTASAFPTAKEQLNNLLLYLAGKATHPSELLLTPTDELIAVIGAIDADGVRYIVQHAIDEDVVRGGSLDFTMSVKGHKEFELGLTVQGWAEAEKLMTKMTKKEQPAMPLNDTQQSERLKVFMCHSKGDKGKVQELYNELINSGADPWFDEEVLLGGQDWELEIKNAVNGAHVFLAFLSPNMVSKEGYVQKELKLGLETALMKPEGMIYIIPVILDACEVPPSLQKYHWIDLSSLVGFTKLLKALQKRASELELPTSITIPE